jgi:ornithine carbamoyltransferase
MKHLLSIRGLETGEIQGLFGKARELREHHRLGKTHQPLLGKTLGMIFYKSSTRTRVSFEVAMFQLGGHALYLNAEDIQLGRGETLADTARVLSGYVDAVLIRTFSQGDLEEFARHSSVPVINGLTDQAHPCQVLADLFTVEEHFGKLEGLKIAYVGDGNNVAHSWLLAAGRLGLHLSLATPKGYGPREEVQKEVLALAKESGARVKVGTDPAEAARGAHVLYTDTWVSMGNEAQRAKRLKDFQDYRVDAALLALADPKAVVMHCLPAHRGEEISAAAMDGPQSVIFQEAENRLHVQKAILVSLLKAAD